VVLQLAQPGRSLNCARGCLCNLRGPPFQCWAPERNSPLCKSCCNISLNGSLGNLLGRGILFWVWSDLWRGFPISLSGY
jgi:hypothetical protein